MMTRENIVVELLGMGYGAVSYDAVKNGVLFEGIALKSEDSIISPVIYTKELIEKAERENQSVRDVASAIIEMYNVNRNVDFNPMEFLDRNFALSHIRIGLQKKSLQEIVKQDSEFEGIESYLYIFESDSQDGILSLTVSESYLKEIGVSISEAWDHAKENTFSETKIENLANVLADLAGMEYDESMNLGVEMYCITNQSGIRGASAICDREKITEFFHHQGVKKIVVLPSSIHEMLLIPYTDDMDLEMFDEMVAVINATDVAPEDRLTDQAYTLTL